MTHFTVYQSRIKDNGAEEVTNLYEYEDEDQAQDEVTRINRNLQLAGVPSTVSYAYYEVEQLQFTDKQLDCIREMVEGYRSHLLDLYYNPPSVTLFTKTQRELFQILGIACE
jgi:hypothetical protein